MGDRPLASRTVIVTRSAEQAGPLASRLEALGATVAGMPVIAFTDPPDPAPAREAASSVGSYDWVVFGSANAAARFIPAAGAEAFAGVGVAAVGAATAERVRDLGVKVDLVPHDYRAEGLVEAFSQMGAAGLRVLVPRALEGREVLTEGLGALGAEVAVVAVYRTVPADPDPVAFALLAAGAADAVTFTSPSTVRNFLAVVRSAGLDERDVMGRVLKASIGPVTTRALGSAGYRADVEADPSTAEGLAMAIVAGLG